MYALLTHKLSQLSIIVLVCLLILSGNAIASGRNQNPIVEAIAPVNQSSAAQQSAVYPINASNQPTNPTATCEQYDFGSAGLQLYVYSDGRAWNFTAESSMEISSVETKSVLASTSGTFYIQVKINSSVIASWSQFVNNTTYTPYYHSADVSTTVNPGDTITYFINGGTMSTPAGGITGVNYLEVCEE